MDIFEKGTVDVQAFGRFLLDKFPIFEYVDLGEDINLAIFGDSGMRMDFFKMAASCCHMVGKKLTVTLVGSGADRLIEKFLEENPMAGSTFFVQRLGMDGMKNVISRKLDTDAVHAPLVFVNVVAEELDCLEKISAIDHMAYPDASGSLFSYSWVIGSDSEGNSKMGKWIEKYLDGADFFKKGRRRSFVGEVNIGKGQMLGRADTKQRIMHVLVNVDQTGEEIALFEKELLEKAFSVHRFYAKEYNSRQDLKSMRKDFDKAYARASSVRSAISIPYKVASVVPIRAQKRKQDPTELAALGFQGISREAVREFAQIVFGEEKQGKAREKLVYLEHKSWMVWLICNGWQRVPLDNIGSYAYIGGNDFKDKGNKRHPCLVECLPEGRMYLDDGGKIGWHESSLEKIRDPLDRVSLELYLYAKEKTQEICAEGGEADRLFRNLTEQMLTNLGGRAGYPVNKILTSIQLLKNAFQKLVEEERNAVNHFKRCVYEFRQEFAEELERDQRLGHALEEICVLVRIVEEAARHRSYKRSDLTLLQAIPYILNAGRIRCIYKLESKEKPWENMYSTVWMEPQKTVILRDDLESEPVVKEEAKYRDVLESMGLGHISCEAIGIQEAVRKKLLKNVGERDIVDITDAEPSFVYRVQKMPEFAQCQCIVIRDGEVINLTQEERQGYLYPQQKSLTVGETLRLSDVYYYTERDANMLASFANSYWQVWELYSKTLVPKEWKKLCAFFWHADQKNGRKIITSQSGSVTTHKTEKMLARMLEITNVKNVLNDMQADGWVESYQILKEGKYSMIEVKTKYEDIVDAVQWMVKQVQENLDSSLSYRTRKVGYTPRVCYLYDDADKLCLRQGEDIGKIGSLGLENEFGEYTYLEIQNVLRKLAKSGQAECLFEKIDTQNGITVTLKDTAAKYLMEREGNALEQYVYFTMRNQAFDDVKLSVSMAFAPPDKFKDPYTDTTNEVDVIATKGMETYFVSCKQSRAQKDYLTEIKYFSDHLGVRGKAILICSNKNERAFQAVRKRADIMGVYFITNTVIKQGKLGEALGRILQGAGVEAVNHMCGL